MGVLAIPMSNQEARAQALIQEAGKKMNPTGFLSMFSGPKFDDAAELYSKAANMYKIAKKWDKAGDTYQLAADAYRRCQYGHEAATCCINAAMAYKKTNTQKARECMLGGIRFYTEEGRFSMAAKYQKEVAEMCEADEDISGAMEAYQTAAEYYEGEGAVSSGNQCLLKVAHFAALQEDYDKAIQIFDQVAETSLENKLLKYGVKEYFFKATVCHLATGDGVNAKRALEKYQDMDYTFSSTRECTFLTAAVEAFEQFDIEAFTNAIVEFDSIQKLDNWKTTMLLRVKKAIKDEDPSIC